SELCRFGFVVDDTSMVYMTKMVSSAGKLVNVFGPLCENFLGISKDARANASALIPEFLISYGIILYKRFGYEVIAEHYAAHNTIDPSKMNLPKDLLDEITADLSQVVETLRTIVTVFKTFGAYFAEYQIADSEDLNDVIASLEEHGYGTEAISTLTEEEVARILGGVASADKK
ncbi:hypothetical protein, partial [Lysinibacillus xylanilyticus]|uniref:hypothetical protein n=1 Tax=Lysinibacillus xylanilyticus TaxID=582475 RepID=UPI0036DE5B77